MRENNVNVFLVSISCGVKEIKLNFQRLIYVKISRRKQNHNVVAQMSQQLHDRRT